MKIGDLVTVKPARAHLYLIVDSYPDQEQNWPDSNGVVAGMLWELLGPTGTELNGPMYEKFIEVINESR